MKDATVQLWQGMPGGFITHEQQAEQDAHYWRGRSVQEKMQVITELAEWYARIHGIDLDAQGPKRIARVIERV